MKPQSMMADNDEATGRIVDAISHSPLWGSSLIVVGGGAIPAAAATTWSSTARSASWPRRGSRRGYPSSSMFDLGSVYRTMETIVGCRR